MPTSANAALATAGSSARHPEVIGRFRVEKLIDTGSVGKVFEARDPDSDSVVAVKLCRELDEAHQELARRQLVNEMKIARELDHPNIVRVMESGMLGERPYIVMEYVPNGRTLKRHCKEPKERLPLPLIVEIGMKCASALHYAHGKGIIHRDIKPANILLRNDGEPKLTDFSIAMLEDTAASVTKLSGAGSPLYMAPEQIHSDEADATTDIYSLGVVMYELLALCPPFAGRSIPELVNAIIREPLPPITSIRPDVPHGLDAILRRALAKHTTKRYASALNLYADLELVRESL